MNQDVAADAVHLESGEITGTATTTEQQQQQQPQQLHQNGVDATAVTIDIDGNSLSYANGNAPQHNNSLANDIYNNNNKSVSAATVNNAAKLAPPSPSSLSSPNYASLKSSGCTSTQRNVLLVLVIVAAVSCVTLTWYYFDWMFGLLALTLGVGAVLLVVPGWRWFYIALVTSKRDIIAIIAYIRLLILVKGYKRKNLTIADVFQTNVAKYPDKVAIVSESQSWTFRQLDEFSNRVANTFHGHGYKKGDVVGLMLENRAEFVGYWLGLSKIGVITSLINTNLRGPSLVHSITVAHCMALIYGEAFIEAVETIANDIPGNVAMYQFNNSASQPVSGLAEDLATILQTAASDKVANTAQHPNHHDKLVYIYTSGTTGLPKAAVISHSRYMFIASAIHLTLGFKHKDIFYTPLPLYHTAGGNMCVGQTLVFGSTVAIRKKFSASGYFADCARFNSTIGQYIGEMARYILATPPSENDKQHKVRMIFGNGLRPQIWPKFVERFNIVKVGEFYGATEGNANIMNNDNTVGAVGFISRILPQIYPISIIRVDPKTGEPLRGENGLCQLCAPYEPGVFIGKIIKGNPAREFLGYVDEKASAKKIVHDVFKKGDMAFLSGDLLMADERGYLFFMDRTGDTYRWKGENVSTSEVEAHVSNVAGYKDTVVYGVTIPNTEGRAGMAAIYDPDRQLNLDSFSAELCKVLPAYAKPLFLRLPVKIDLTGTFKLRKVELQRDGFNPNVIDDALYYLTTKGKYEPLTVDVYEQICRGDIRF